MLGGTTHTLSINHCNDICPSEALVSGAALLDVQLTQQVEYKPDFVGEEGLRALGYSDALNTRQTLAHATFTQAKYKSKWTLFTAWTRDRKTKSNYPMPPTLIMLSEFLTYLFQD